jgi:dethiobiotin synthetase
VKLLAKSYFITGTDTDVGKTFVTVALMRYFRQQGQTVLAMKPVASACIVGQDGLRNEDALLLQRHASKQVDYHLINPYAFALPVSPHIAAQEVGQEVELSVINKNYQVLKELAEVVLVEGIGGWLAPINQSADVADLAISLQLPVILVVAIRLGCISHARLSYAAIKSSGITCAGWIANCTEEHMLNQQENIETITQKVQVPLLGVVPYSKEAAIFEGSEIFSSLNSYQA